MITALYTSLLGMLWLGLTMYVILGRWKYEVSLGDGDEKDLNRRIRAHANFSQPPPLFGLAQARPGLASPGW